MGTSFRKKGGNTFASNSSQKEAYTGSCETAD